MSKSCRKVIQARDRQSKMRLMTLPATQSRLLTTRCLREASERVLLATLIPCLCQTSMIRLKRLLKEFRENRPFSDKAL